MRVLANGFLPEHAPFRAHAPSYPSSKTKCTRGDVSEHTATNSKELATNVVPPEVDAANDHDVAVPNPAAEKDCPKAGWVLEALAWAARVAKDTSDAPALAKEARDPDEVTAAPNTGAGAVDPAPNTGAAVLAPNTDPAVEDGAGAGAAVGTVPGGGDPKHSPPDVAVDRVVNAMDAGGVEGSAGGTLPKVGNLTDRAFGVVEAAGGDATAVAAAVDAAALALAGVLAPK